MVGEGEAITVFVTVRVDCGVDVDPPGVGAWFCKFVLAHVLEERRGCWEIGGLTLQAEPQPE